MIIARHTFDDPFPHIIFTISENKVIKLLVLEHKNKCEIIKIAHLIMNSEEYQLSGKYMEKFLSSYKLAARITIICLKIVFILIDILVFTFMTLGYYDNQVDYSVIVVLIWLVIVLLSLYYALSNFIISCAYTYVLTQYMKYRFRQVQDLIEIYLKRGNAFQTI